MSSTKQQMVDIDVDVPALKKGRQYQPFNYYTDPTGSDNKLTGRPSKFTEDIAYEFCILIGQGYTLKDITDRDDMPSARTFYTWCNGNESFLSMYTRAKSESARVDADKIEVVAAATLRGIVEPNAARVAIDAYKWCAARKRPLEYGDRIQHDVVTRDYNTMTDDELERDIAAAKQDNDLIMIDLNDNASKP